MGGNSAPSSSSTVTNKSVQYGNTATVNPFASSITNNNGTFTALNDGTALNTVYNYLNSNMAKLLDEYLHPSLDSQTNQAKLNAFSNALTTNSKKSLENDIISPLSDRNMIRSSSAQDLYNKLAENNTAALAQFSNDLLTNSQNDTAKVINNLLDAYMFAYSVASDNQAQSLATSKGNAATSSVSNTNKTSTYNFLHNISDIFQSLDPATKALLNITDL